MNEEKNLNKNYIIIIILAVLVLIGGWLISSGGTQQPITAEEEVTLQKQAGEIINTGDIKACDQIDNDTYKAVCKNNIALELAQKNLDIKQCQNVDNSLVPREECERKVVLKKSVEDEDISVCDQATSIDLKNECKNLYYLQVALKNNDSSVCNSVVDLLQKNICKDTFTFQTDFTQNADTFDCEKFSGNNFKNDCKNLKQLVVSKNINPSECASFKTPSFGGLCQALSRNFIQRSNQ